ncbi:hypothetical protein [Rhodoblastus sp.]|jgi:hypothetical protein|uniref:hypothetical protein n=1 Tax=Rhodoblastus sp. TaxID=1962975 RepID=UPI0025F56A9E|nr:hypothetical protein [Rhodoblastus sp.]
MKPIDRRGLLRGLMIATAATAVGVSFGTSASEAMPLDARIATPPDELIQKAQVVVVAPRRRRRRWVCWWNRGRRVCGWRWF